MRKSVLFVFISYLISTASIAGPGLPKGGFGQESDGIGYNLSSKGSDGGYSVMNEVGPPPPPPDIPIDGGILLVLASGLLLGGRKIVRQLIN